MSDDFQSHELLTATKLNRSLRAGRCIARGRRVTNSSTVAASSPFVAVLRIDDIPVTSSRLYTIVSSSLGLDTSQADNVGQAVITYTTDGSTPVVGSTVLPGSLIETNIHDTVQPEAVIINTSYTPASDQTLSLLLCIARRVGTGAIMLVADGTNTIIELSIFDSGEDPGDVGVDL